MTHNPLQQRDTHDQADFVTTAADLLGGWMRRTLQTQDRCTLVLSGGSTPVPIYRALSKDASIDWQRVWVIGMDERFVPPDHAESNQRMIRETLTVPAGIPAQHCLFPDTTLPLAAAVDAYERAVLAMVGNDLFSIAVFGMGDDGHTASLFPPVTDEGLTRMGMAHTTTDRFAVRDRIGMALPLLKRSTEKLLLLSGADKLRTWQEMLHAPSDHKRWPLQALLDERMTVLTCSPR